MHLSHAQCLVAAQHALLDSSVPLMEWEALHVQIVVQEITQRYLDSISVKSHQQVQNYNHICTQIISSFEQVILPML